MNPKYLKNELEDKILDTVDDCIRNIPKPYSLVFSGGFDSGLLAAITEPKHLFRIKFPYGTKFDESRYARAIVRYLGIEDKLVEIEITSQDFKINFEDAVKAYGEVTTHFSLVPFYILFKTMKEFGVDEVISGEGPDEYLGGYTRYIIFDELRKLYEIPELRNYHGVIEKVVGNNLVKKYSDMMGYGVNKMGTYPLQGQLGKADMEFGKIEKMEQKLANHFGIHLHYPYLNVSLAEYCYNLPDDMKIKNGRTKVAFKEICMKYLPEIMRDRNKMGGPVAPVNRLMGWLLDDFDKSMYIQKQKEILG